MTGNRHRPIVPAASRRRALIALAALATSGCGYSFRAPYDKSVQTVYVPMFKSQTFTRDVENADTILSGSVNFVDKNILVENPFNLPRQLTRTINASVNWVHNPPTEAEKKREPTIISETLNFVPEVGETAVTASYAVCQRLAAQIVDMMEQPWYTEEDLK